MFDWLPWLMGGSTIALLILAIVAPSVLQVAASWLSALSPLVKAVAEGLVAFWNILWIGFKDIVDNWKTVVTVAVITLLAVWYFHTPEKACPTCPAPVVCKPGYKAVPQPKPKQPASKQEEDVLSIIKRQFGL